MKKRIGLMLVFMLTMCMSMMADKIKVITFDQLPVQAQTILKQHFADKVPAVVTIEGKEYKVVYQSGEKAEFNKKGKWMEFDCNRSPVPTALIPEQIRTAVQQTFPSATIVKIERVRKNYEVKLNNGMEMKFNKRFKMIEFDD
ncbi:MAG: PepSY-like domain-containing protein [Bacteroidaceae bacterium]|jgi:hypothetical protein|nr:PepSY-like domain-containing protein [Bacteroidaceae bacterium]